MKKIIISFVLLLSMLSSLFIINASGVETVKLRSNKDAIKYIESRVNDVKATETAINGGVVNETNSILNVTDNEEAEYNVVAEHKINSFTNGKSYLLCILSPIGYVIYDEISGVIEEIDINGESPYDVSQGGEFYYGGPMNYIVKIGRVYKNISDERVLSEEELSNIITMETYTVNNRRSIRCESLKENSYSPTGLVPIITETKYMKSASFFTSLPYEEYTDNVTGICAQVACQIMLRFYDAKISPYYIPTKYSETATLMKFLQIFLGDSGVQINKLVSGMDRYFEVITGLAPANFHKPTVERNWGVDEVFAVVKERIAIDRPTMILMFNKPDNICNMDHAVVAYGYSTDYFGNSVLAIMYYVHNGWKNGEELGSYSWDWFENCICFVE